MDDKAIIQLPVSQILHSFVREQMDKRMNPVKVFVIELANKDILELHGNWQSAYSWDADKTFLIIIDDLNSDCLIVRKRKVKKVAKPWYINHDRDYPHPFEFINITISGIKYSLITYVLRVKEDSRIYQLDTENGTNFFHRIRKILDEPYYV
jgi:hypothetical protein